MEIAAKPHTERWLVAAAVGIAFGSALFVPLSLLPLPLAMIVALAFAIALTIRVAPRLPSSLDGVFSRRRTLALAWAILAVACLGL
ncbi:MAG: hypothetical protein ACRELY_28850, partial [Polyangiaceae bacterium]